MHVQKMISVVASRKFHSVLSTASTSYGSLFLNCQKIAITNLRTLSTGISQSKLDLKIESDGTALVTMKSGDNRFHPETIDEWNSILDQIEINPNCRSMVTTGVDKFYSNGLDTDYVKSFTSYQRQFAEYLDKFNRFLARILVFPLPTVAAINGHAFAGGALLALAHDMRVMRNDKGWFSLNEVLFDGRFTPFHMEMMRCKMTSDDTRSKTLFFAKRYTGQEALNYGIVDKVIDQSELVETAKLLANEALGKQGLSRDNLTLFKKDLYRSVLESKPMPEEWLKPLRVP